MIGELFDSKYEIVKLIGEGGMGAVYEAKHATTGRTVAVKVISIDAVVKDDVVIARFEREARAAAKMLSPHIVEILDAGHDKKTGHPYMVMEKLTGENLHHLLKRLGALPPQLAVRIAVQTCVGLEKAHAVGVVHRDIKPANLFLAEADDDAIIMKLLDFGVAKVKMDAASDTGNQSLTRTGSMLGSPMFMSPEQARGLKTIDHRADIWSLGILLYQLLTGRAPHQDIEGLGELVITICSEEPEWLGKQAEWVQPELASVVHGALKLAPDERYQSAKEFREALEEWLGLDSKIDQSMLVPLSDDERAARPQQDAGPSSSSAETVAIENVDDLIAEAEAKKEAAGTADAASFNASPVGAEEQSATVALDPAEFGAIADELDRADEEVKKRDAEARAEKPTDDGRVVTVPSAGQEARTERRPSAAGRVVTAVLAGVLIGGGVLYLMQRGQSAAPVAPAPSVSSTALAPSATGPLPTTAASTPPVVADTAKADSGAAETADAGDEATQGTVKVQIMPSFANVTVDGASMPPSGGYIELERTVGKSYSVVVRLGSKHTQATIKITDDGPVPATVILPLGGGRVGGPSKGPPKPDLYE